MIALSRAVGAIEVLRNNAFQPHVAGNAEWVGADLAFLILGDEDAFDGTRKQSREIGLAEQ